MTEEEILANAYLVMGKKVGTPMEEINTRYKRLAMVWHSDRFTSAESKEEAEEEMKKINNARDVLKKHFSDSHKATGYCACRANATAEQPKGTGTGQAPGPGKRRTTQENNNEEAQARRRSEERARRAAEEEAAAKAREAAARAQAAAAQTHYEKTALEQTKLENDERLRWKISVCMVIAWVGLNIFGGASMNAKSWWHDFSWKWERDHQPPAPAPQTNTENNTPGYVPAYNKFPGGDQNSWQEQQNLDQQRRDERAAQQRKQDIYDTRAAIDRYQKTIDHCTSEISKVDAQLADPSVSDYEKRKSSSYQNAQRGYLAEAQSNLAEAQRRFTELTGRPASEANTTTWGPDSPATITPSSTNNGSLLNGSTFTNSAQPPAVNSDSVQPWRPAYSPNSTPGLTPSNTSTFPSTPSFNQDSLFNTDPSKSTNPLFKKQNYLFKKTE